MDTRVLTESDVHWILRIFLEDGELVSNRDRLCLALGLTISQLEDIKFTVAMDRSQTHGFLALGLTKWMCINTNCATVDKLTEVLRNEGFIAVADKIFEVSPERERVPSIEMTHSFDPASVWFNVPEEVSAFTGRHKEMEGIHESVMGQNAKKIGQREVTVITTVSGLGGIGKTTLAIHYAWRYFRDHFFFNVIWINAETTDTIEKSFHGLADKVGLNTLGSSETTLNPIELASRIYNHFEQTSTLFIFDNVEQYEHVKSYLPIKSPKTSRQYVLITSRNREWNCKTDMIVLNVFSENDSIEFLTSYLKLETEVEIELAKEIVRRLRNLPLAIRQAGAYIEKVCSDDYPGAAEVMRLYLQLLRTKSERVLSFKCDSYEKTVYSTWKVTMDKIKRRNYLAVRIMQIISYFNSDNIPIQLLRNIPEKRYFERVVDSMFFDHTNINESTVLNAVKLLSEFSMVTRDSQFNISVHRLVQKVIRDDVERYSLRTILQEAMRTVEIPLETTVFSDYERDCLLHAISVSMHIHSNYWQYNYKKFVDFITSKQDNSMDKHIQRLFVLIKESKFDEAEASFYRTRNEYFTYPNGLENVLSQLFTGRFVNCICKRIWNLNSTKQGDILKLSELCRKLLVGFELSFSGSKYLSTNFQISADDLKFTRDSTDVIQIPHNLAETASQMYKILFDYFLTDRNCLDVCRNFQGVIDCFSFLERWTDAIKMVESLSELEVDWSQSEELKLNRFLSLRRACDRICEIAMQMNYETSRDAQNRIFDITLRMYSTLYTYFRQRKNYELTLKCGVVWKDTGLREKRWNLC